MSFRGIIYHLYFSKTVKFSSVVNRNTNPFLLEKIHFVCGIKLFWHKVFKKYSPVRCWIVFSRKTQKIYYIISLVNIWVFIYIWWLHIFIKNSVTENICTQGELLNVLWLINIKSLIDLVNDINSLCFIWDFKISFILIQVTYPLILVEIKHKTI